MLGNVVFKVYVDGGFSSFADFILADNFVFDF